MADKIDKMLTDYFTGKLDVDIIAMMTKISVVVGCKTISSVGQR
jgi:hypothetical protein